MSTWSPFSLSGTVPVNIQRQPRCITGYDENHITIGFASGEISTFERSQPTDQFTQTDDSDHKILKGIVFGLNQVPEGHETLTETSLLIGGGDKTLRNALVDGTELFSVGPLTHPTMAHSGAVEIILFANDRRQTLITAGWDGQVKFWRGDEVMMSLTLKNQYSTQVALVGTDRLVVGSASKNLSFIKIDYDKLYTVFDARQAAHNKNKSSMSDFDEFGENSPAGAATASSESGPILTDQIAIANDVIQYLDFSPNAHDHAIRRVIPLYKTLDDAKNKAAGLVASIGNDGHLKVWDVTGDKLQKVIEIEVLQSYGDQSEFIYDCVQYFGPVLGLDGTLPGELVVLLSCDDRTIRTISISSAIAAQDVIPTRAESLLISDKTNDSFHSKFEVQCLELPSVARTLYTFQPLPADSDPSFDFVALSPSGAYTFSFDKTKWSNEESIQAFNNTIQANIEKAKKMTNIDLDTLPQPDVLLKVGAKDGEHKIVNIDGKPMVVQWSNERYEWVLIGEAVGANNDQGQGNKKQYKGKFYDNIVDVEAGAGSKLTLAFNSDDDPYDVAQAFIHEHQIDVGATQQIVQFISPYIDQKKLQRKKEAAELAKLNQLSAFSQSTWASLSRSTINLTLIQNAMSKRIQEFLQSDPSMLWAGATGVVATDKIFGHLCWAIQQAPTVQPATVINSNDLAALSTMLSKWPAANLTPVLDIIRVLSYEATANNVMFNPTAQGFDQTFNDLLLSKLLPIFHTALSSSEQNAFASLSLTFDIFSHAVGRRTNLRQLPAQFDLFDQALPKLFKMVSSSNSQGATLSTFLTTFPNGFKLLPSIYRLVHNVTSFCNRVGTQSMPANPPPQIAQLPPKIQSTIDQWVKFFVSLLDKIPVGSDGAWDKDVHMYEFIIDAAHMLIFEADCYVELKKHILTNHTKLVTTTLPKSLIFYHTNLAKTTEEKNQVNFLLRDFQIMFKAQK